MQYEFHHPGRDVFDHRHPPPVPGQMRARRARQPVLADYTTAGNLATVADTSAVSTGVTRSYKYQGDPGVTCGGFPGQQCTTTTTKTTTTGNGKTSSYTYNTTGQLTKITPPAPGVATTFGYDSLSRLTSVHTPNGITVTYSYDNRDQRTQTVYSVGGTVV